MTLPRPSSQPRPTSSRDEVPGPRPLVPPYRDEDEGRGIGPTLFQDHEDEVAEWQERLQAAVAETLRKRAARRTERAELDARRKAGLVQRYVLKAARLRRSEGERP